MHAIGQPLLSVPAAIVMNVAFGTFSAIPTRKPNVRADLTLFRNYTFWLNVVFGGLAVAVWYIDRKTLDDASCLRAITLHGQRYDNY